MCGGSVTTFFFSFRMDVKILEAAWKSFRSSCLELTRGHVDPLIGKFFTLPSYSAAIYKTLFMKYPIGIVPYGGKYMQILDVSAISFSRLSKSETGFSIVARLGLSGLLEQ